MNNLVEYSSSSSESDDGESEILKKKIKLELPMLLLDRDDKHKQSTSDRPENHQMRTRTIPHIEGNWASHIKIECAVNSELSLCLDRIVAKYEEIQLIDEPHLSLSKTFILKHHWIGNFVKSLKGNFERSSGEFLITFDNTKMLYLANEDKTRHFACLGVNDLSYPKLGSIVRKVDSCLKEFNLPTYYEDPKFHISFLWKLEEFSSVEKLEIEKQILTLSENNLITNVEYLILKTGNKFFTIKI